MLKSSFLLSLLMIAGAVTAWAGHTVTFYVNGKKVSTATVEEGASIPFPEVTAPRQATPIKVGRKQKSQASRPAHPLTL